MKTNNNNCKISFILGLVSIILFNIVIIPIIAIIFGIKGLCEFNPKKQNNKWMAITGTILGILYLCTYIVFASK